jgi:hypothetical protein
LKIYELLARAAELTPERRLLIANYAEGLAHWRAREFDRAATCFGRSASVDRPAALFRDRAGNWPRRRPAATGTRSEHCKRSNRTDRPEPGLSALPDPAQ